MRTGADRIGMLDDLRAGAVANDGLSLCVEQAQLPWREKSQPGQQALEVVGSQTAEDHPVDGEEQLDPANAMPSSAGGVADPFSSAAGQ